MPRSVNELLTGGGALGRLSRALPAQQSWLEWLRAQLDAELSAHVIGVVPKSTVPGSGAALELVVLADAGGWCTRLRYALAPLQATLCERAGGLARVSVRVALPGAGSGG